MLTNASVVALLGITVLVFTMVAWFRLAGRAAIPENRFFFLVLWTFAGVLGVAGLFNAAGDWLSMMLGSLACLGAGLVLVLYRLGRQGDNGAIEVGEQMPSFSAMDDAGREFESRTLAGRWVLLKFFRGHW